jgi:hypothetical protein
VSARRVLARLAAPAILLAIALPAHGDSGGSATPLLTPQVLNQLTAIDNLPSIHVLSELFTTEAAAQSLATIASDPNTDPGIRIRAVRTMAGYCTGGDPDAHCADPGSQVHTAITNLIQAYLDNPAPTPTELVLMRAAVETLGVANAVAPDVDVPHLLALLKSESRDVRATVVRTLSTTCALEARDVVSTLKRTEPTAQVRGELNLAEQTISTRCPSTTATPSP